MSEFNDQENEQVVETYVDVTPDTPVINKKGFGIASLVLGITAFFPGCCCTVVGMIILGALAIVFAILFLNANKDLTVGKGMAKAGFILGIIAIVLAIILTIISIALPSFDYKYDYENYFEDFLED
ncbi:MAG: hypothetical protein CVU84_05065 [Firmicutes bacterium HGW-Firmicutes-1]|jgi:amino acid transporter|nr:MAG: hypothetical protein CVU84_05065 [Firmicutes bacterium HGW-Firmicutes-1]